MLQISYHWFKRDHQHLEFEWRMNTFFLFIETKLETDLVHLSNARLREKETPTDSWKDSWKFVYSLVPILYFTQSNRFLFEMPPTARDFNNELRQVMLLTTAIRISWVIGITSIKWNSYLSCFWQVLYGWPKHIQIL